MAVVIPPESVLGKELERWNVPKRLGGEAPDGFLEYPKMLYKAFRYENGKVMCGHPDASTGENVKAMTFERQCQATVKNQDEHERHVREGWYESPGAAVAGFERAERAMADEAAHGEFKARRMSDAAKKEFDDAQNAASFHDPEVAAKPLPPKPAESKTERKNRLARERRAAKG